MVRPERVQVARRAAGNGGRGVPATVDEVIFRGATVHVGSPPPTATAVVADVGPTTDLLDGLRPGDPVWATWAREAAYLVPRPDGHVRRHPDPLDELERPHHDDQTSTVTTPRRPAAPQPPAVPRSHRRVPRSVVSRSARRCSASACERRTAASSDKVAVARSAASSRVLELAALHRRGDASAFRGGDRHRPQVHGELNDNNEYFAKYQADLGQDQ